MVQEILVWLAASSSRVPATVNTQYDALADPLCFFLSGGAPEGSDPAPDGYQGYGATSSYAPSGVVPPQGSALPVLRGGRSNPKLQDLVQFWLCQGGSGSLS